MTLSIILLIVGLLLILGGANILTDGASALAKRFNISDLVIGLTIVAFGTSAPELVISVVSALEGNAGIAVGNVIGSNIFNILMIVGCTAVVSPIVVSRGTLSREIPLVILSSVVLLALAGASLIDGGGTNALTRASGIVLLCFFAIFMAYSFSIAHSGAAGEAEQVKEMPLWRSVVYILGGLAGLILGGQWFVDGASAIARALNVSDAVIGLTIVAVGTSLPELATSIVAALKHNPGIAVGNVIGSCLFNVFFILGVAATIHPFAVPDITAVDYGTLIGASLLLWLFGMVIGERTIKRAEGIILILCYIAYTAYLIANV